jgi:pimeloyl-ACP methyl ester carboxylesterase
MPRITANGISLSYERVGTGDPVLFVMGSGASGRVWTMHQTPALTGAGYECVTFDNRGVAPSDVPPGRYSLDDLVADTRGLIDGLRLGPCRVVATSLGASIVQELLRSSPELVSSAVLIATYARADAMRRALMNAERTLAASDVRLPADYDAANTVLQMFSPATLNDDATVSSLLDVFELSGAAARQASGQLWADVADDRRDRLRGITVPCRVIAFSDDLMTPPRIGAEVAEAIPDCDYVEVSSCGHLGYLERPDEVNKHIIEFFKEH